MKQATVLVLMGNPPIHDQAQGVCTRCQGLLVHAWCTDLLDGTSRIAAQRCVSCGDVVDAVILQNRRQPSSLAARGRGGE